MSRTPASPSCPHPLPPEWWQQLQRRSSGSGSQTLLALTPFALPKSHILMGCEGNCMPRDDRASEQYNSNAQLIKADIVCQPPCSPHMEKSCTSLRFECVGRVLCSGQECGMEDPNSLWKCFLDLESQESLCNDFSLFSLIVLFY